MKTTLKIVASLLFLGIAVTTIAQQSTSATKPATTTKAKSKTSKPKGIDNKIAVSDQAQTSEKGNKKQPVKSDKGVSNK